jgi:hypothetical protein
MKKNLFALTLTPLAFVACAQAPMPGPVVVGQPQVMGQPQVVGQPAPVWVAPPPGVVVPAGVVYAAPSYPAPAVGFVWAYHPRFGWGWRHPEHGWHRGWR